MGLVKVLQSQSPYTITSLDDVIVAFPSLNDTIEIKLTDSGSLDGHRIIIRNIQLSGAEGGSVNITNVATTPAVEGDGISLEVGQAVQFVLDVGNNVWWIIGTGIGVPFPSLALDPGSTSCCPKSSS